MNERVRELLANALDNETVIASKSFGHWPLYDEDLEKFAELIVRECVSILENNNPRPPGTVIMYSLDQDEHFDTGWQVATETKVHRIKQHFGIK